MPGGAAPSGHPMTGELTMSHDVLKALCARRCYAPERRSPRIRLLCLSEPLSSQFFSSHRIAAQSRA